MIPWWGWVLISFGGFWTVMFAVFAAFIPVKAEFESQGFFEDATLDELLAFTLLLPHLTRAGLDVLGDWIDGTLKLGDVTYGGTVISANTWLIKDLRIYNFKKGG